jgi:HPt (histidine-containing phosphotransfer) domain-containing protein
MISAQDRYQHINLSYILDVADGDEDFIKESISTYLTSIPENITSMIAAVNAHNCELVNFHAHTLKGAFNFVGNGKLAALCDTLEGYCHDKDQHERIPAIIAEIIPLANKTVIDLEMVLSKLSVK